MGSNKIVLGLVGSPNPEGRTKQLVTTALEGAAKVGASTELVHMSDYVVKACQDCQPWVCWNNKKCTYPDESFTYLSQKIMDCGALILGTPIYWWDTSGLVRYFMLKMFRVYARSAPLYGLPAFGIGIAGGTGNGLVSGLRPIYNFFQLFQMRALEPLPATRFNFAAALRRAGELGEQIAPMTSKRDPFTSFEERILWYDALPYLKLSLFEERRLLADLTTAALPPDADASIPSGLGRADALLAAGRPLEALSEITRVYEAGVKSFEGS